MSEKKVDTGKMGQLFTSIRDDDTRVYPRSGNAMKFYAVGNSRLLRMMLVKMFTTNASDIFIELPT
jgi:hypothetical protein